MALILNIDTAVTTASVCLANNGEILSFEKNENSRDHSTWLHTAIKNIFDKAGKSMNELDAVAVTGGPGSYTGLRIGMATAKGICYAMNKPLIILNTLQVMANSALQEEAEQLCPMIDARRMEVFAAIYDKKLNVIKNPAAIILEDKSFAKELETHRICFFGNGSNKYAVILKHPNAYFAEIKTDARNMVLPAEERFRNKEFADLAYVEPLYLKEFYTTAK